MSGESWQRRIEARGGTGFLLRRGQTLRVTDVEGGQVADLFAVARERTPGRPVERLCNGRTFDSLGSLRITAGSSILFRAEMDLAVGVAACSAPTSNDHRFTAVDVEVLPARP